jgi:hypothetical protein
MIKLNKTENEILQEIQRKGYTSIEHGIIKHKSFGNRRVNARNSLIVKGLIKVTWQKTECDSAHGVTDTFYLSRVEKA